MKCRVSDTCIKRMFRSCTVLLSSSPVIEVSKRATVEVESRSQTPSLRLRRWLVYIDCARTVLTTFYHNIIIYASSELSWGVV